MFMGGACGTWPRKSSMPCLRGGRGSRPGGIRRGTASPPPARAGSPCSPVSPRPREASARPGGRVSARHGRVGRWPGAWGTRPGKGTPHRMAKAMAFARAAAPGPPNSTRLLQLLLRVGLMVHPAPAIPRRIVRRAEAAAGGGGRIGIGRRRNRICRRSGTLGHAGLPRRAPPTRQGRRMFPAAKPGSWCPRPDLNRHGLSAQGV